jgi:hypothetical protein
MNWFCLYSTIAGEFRALADLQSRKFVAYLPLATRIRTARGQRQELQVPLLPRYLFVFVRDFNRLGELLEISTIFEILPHQFDPIPVPTVEIEWLKQREEAGEFRFKETVTSRKRERRILRRLEDLVILRKEQYVGAS